MDRNGWQLIVISEIELVDITTCTSDVKDESLLSK